MYWLRAPLSISLTGHAGLHRHAALNVLLACQERSVRSV
jgi:hypothetical protein